MRIIRLQAEGFKRLVAVDITPEGNLIEVRGNNGNGKSSVLDAIFAALAGAGAAPEKPVREGEEAAVIRLDLGELIVTRYFTASGTTNLKVTTPEGAAFGSGQTMLDKLVGAISFDPLEFLSLKPAEQAEELRKLVDLVDPETGEMIDLATISSDRARLYAERRDVNRDGTAVKARIEAAGGVRHVPDDAPNRDELLAKLTGAAEKNARIERERARRVARDERLASLDKEIDELEARLAAMKAERVGIADAAGRESPLELLEDVDLLRDKLAEADRVDENRRANAAREGLIAEFEALKARSTELTASIAELDKRRAEAIAAAKMPVEGLELSLLEDGALGVLFNGVPFSQASDAERLKVSAAVAMAANPKLRVLRLKDASLLDKGAVEALREMASANDFQIWAEFVGDEGPGIVMEAGEVRGADKPEPLPKPRQRKAKDEPESREGEVAEAGVQPGPDALENGGNPTLEAGAETSAAERPAAPTTLFERMGETQAPERRRPTAMTEFTSKPRS